MKKLLWAGALVLVLAGLCMLFSFQSSSIETPEYQVLKTLDKVEIRRYPGMLVAKTRLAGSAYKENSSNGFRTIAGYIFGGNESGQKIAMTSPVVMQMGDSASMYFVMPRAYTKNQLPKPNSPSVRIEEEGEKVLAVLRFGGYSSDKKIEAHARELEEILKKHGITPKGSLLYMGYNAPWDAFNRRNEVAFEVSLPTP